MKRPILGSRTAEMQCSASVAHRNLLFPSYCDEKVEICTFMPFLSIWVSHEALTRGDPQWPTAQK